MATVKQPESIRDQPCIHHYDPPATLDLVQSGAGCNLQDTANIQLEYWSRKRCLRDLAGQIE
ncbi:uncharacterized protein RCO7_14015 [Rhynchosporium graminicola]|uniref:Uncharacterized protein n=1 Tax=Rhynchosporium graminicola TaxID=2792576 RepID=A0A1E1K6N7_9HELO|nr:uncharacterized protein RCO7_14015 [Rhynchosporium commune]